MTQQLLAPAGRRRHGGASDWRGSRPPHRALCSLPALPRRLRLPTEGRLGDGSSVGGIGSSRRSSSTAAAVQRHAKQPAAAPATASFAFQLPCIDLVTHTPARVHRDGARGRLYSHLQRAAGRGARARSGGPRLHRQRVLGRVRALPVDVHVGARHLWQQLQLYLQRLSWRLGGRQRGRAARRRAGQASSTVPYNPHTHTLRSGSTSHQPARQLTPPAALPPPERLCAAPMSCASRSGMASGSTMST